MKKITIEELEWHLEDCIQLKKEFPYLIAGRRVFPFKYCCGPQISTIYVGFDLVGPEHASKPLKYYAAQLLHFRERQKEENVDIPFIFHAGETTGDGTEADYNLYDAILLGTKRIGHGCVLTRLG